MPLAKRRGAVPVIPQNPRKRNAIVRNERRIAGEPGRELPDRTKPNRMTVATGQQRRPRRRAQRRHMEPVIPHTLLGDPRVIRGVDRPAKRPGIPEPRIIDQHQQHIRRAIGRLDVPELLPIRLRAPKRPVSHTPERPLTDRKLASIRLAHELASRQLGINGFVFKNSRRSFLRAGAPSSPEPDEGNPSSTPGRPATQSGVAQPDRRPTELDRWPATSSR